MADDVKMTFTGNAADAERAIAQLEKKYDALENKIKRLKTTAKPDGGKSFLDKMGEGAAAAVQNFTGISSGIDSANAGLRIMSAEWDNILQKQEKSLNAHKKFASPLEQTIFNTQGDAEFKTVKSREAEIERIAKATGVSREQVAMTTGDAASAKGQLPLRRAYEATEATLRLLPNTPAAQPVVAGAALDVVKDLPHLQVEDPMGMMIAVGGSSRVKDNEALAKHAMPAIIGVSKIDRMEREQQIREGIIKRPGELRTRDLEDESYRQNAALFSALTQATQDTEGRVSRTALTSAAVQLDEFFRGRPEFAKLDTFHERVQFMQDNPQAAKAFFEGGEFGGKKSQGFQLSVKGPDGQPIDMTADRASFERKVLPGMQDLFTKGSQSDLQYRAALEGMPRLSEGDKVYSEMLGELKTSKTLQVAEQDRRLAGVADRGFFADTSGATTAVIRKSLDESLQAAGYGYASRTTARAEFDARSFFQSPESAAASVIEPLVRNIQSNYGMEPLGLSGRGNGADAQVLQEMLSELRKINDNTGKAVKGQPGRQPPAPVRTTNPEASQ